MIPFLAVLVISVAALAALGAPYARARLGRRSPRSRAPRILFPFAGPALSRHGLDAALRLARAEEATLVPAFLARVPIRVPLDVAVPRQCADGIVLLEAVEQRAGDVGVPVDARVERGRTYRHALRFLLEHERYDRIVVEAASRYGDGLRGADVAWLLDHAPGEVVIVRPDHEDNAAA